MPEASRYDAGMASDPETTIRAYVAAWSTRDPAERARLLEASFAEDGRFVTRTREIRGRAALIAEMERFHATSALSGIRFTSVIDATSTTFRFRGAADMVDGSSPQSVDAGTFDADGRISLLLTFPGALEDLPPG